MYTPLKLNNIFAYALKMITFTPYTHLHDICMLVLLLLFHFYLSSGEIYAKWVRQLSRKFLMKI